MLFLLDSQTVEDIDCGKLRRDQIKTDMSEELLDAIEYIDINNDGRGDYSKSYSECGEDGEDVKDNEEPTSGIGPTHARPKDLHWIQRLK